MTDEAKGEVQIYEFFSECLKLFRKKMVLLCKIANTDDEQLNLHHQQNLNEVIREANSLMAVFQQIQQNDKNIKSIFSRFLLRIKQSVHSFSLKTSSQEINNFLGYLQKIIKQFDRDSRLENLLKIILLKIPRKLCKKSSEVIKNKQSTLRRNSYEEKNDNSIKVTKISKHFDSYDKYIEALERQYRLFECLNIEQPYYRKTFFLALEDLRRKDNNLMQDMMIRNRFAKESLDQYQRSYDLSKKKMQEKKQKVMKTQSNFLISQMKQKTNNSNLFNSLKEKVNKMDSGNFTTAPRRLKTQYLSQNSNARVASIQQKTMIGLKNSFNSHQFPKNKFIDNKLLNKSNQFNSCFMQEDCSIKKRIFDSERQKTRNGMMIPLKKIQFIGSKIELVPEEIEKKSKILNEQSPKKKIYNRTQQHVRKKISFINQAQIHKLIPHRLEMNSATNKNTHNFNSIRVNHFNNQG